MSKQLFLIGRGLTKFGKPVSLLGKLKSNRKKDGVTTDFKKRKMLVLGYWLSVVVE
jgi:hypothetical protein